MQFCEIKKMFIDTYVEWETFTSKIRKKKSLDEGKSGQSKTQEYQTLDCRMVDMRKTISEQKKLISFLSSNPNNGIKQTGPNPCDLCMTETPVKYHIRLGKKNHYVCHDCRGRIVKCTVCGGSCDHGKNLGMDIDSYVCGKCMVDVVRHVKQNRGDIKKCMEMKK